MIDQPKLISNGLTSRCYSCQYDCRVNKANCSVDDLLICPRCGQLNVFNESSELTKPSHEYVLNLANTETDAYLNLLQLQKTISKLNAL